MKPRLLDLFCGAGGCAVGYHRAGWEVVGVDIKPQPRYPYEFHQADALDFPLGGFDAVHASPPCPRYSAATAERYREDHPDLVEPTRQKLRASGLPWVMENVEGSPLAPMVVMCGSMFGLRIRRHRLFESNVMLMQLDCRHDLQDVVLSVTGTGYGGKHKGHNGAKPSGIAEARDVMGIPWMTINELSQAIPPAYTEHIGRQLLASLSQSRP